MKVESAIEEHLKKRAKRYSKSYSEGMVHVDTMHLPLLRGELKTDRREYLFIGIDDFSRELYAGIYEDKFQFSVAMFIQKNLLAQYPYTVDYVYSDDGREYKGTIIMPLLICVD